MAASRSRPGDSSDERLSTVRVLVCDSALDSRFSSPDILAVLASCGVLIERPLDPAALERALHNTSYGIALVAAGRPLSDDSSSFEVIERLHRHGYHVIGYEDGVNTWSLAQRCKFLLRGCACLLDSASDTFAAELKRVLEKTARAAQEQRAHDLQLRDVMGAHGVVGESRAMLAVFASVVKIAPLSDLSILITGESGTGKELLARAIHARDARRRSGPFVAVNCATIPAALAETELFGHRRGAFTGAERDRKGHFRAAHGGVLFLDEIAELDLAIQIKLLRVLQDSRVTSLGDEQDDAVNVRIIAATNGDLAEMVRQRTFRADLFHRLNVLSIHIPPVRERRGDIVPLVEHFARKHQALNPVASQAIGPEFLEALARLQLAGNARQIENLVRAALIHNDGTEPLGLQDFPVDVWQELAAEPPASLPGRDVRSDLTVDLLEANQWSLSRTLHACERSFLQAALHASEGNQSKTARLLGITPRSVYNKLRRYHLS